MSLILFIIHFFVIVFLGSRWSFLKEESITRFELFFFFLLKVGGGFLLLLVYAHIYPQRNLADVFKYFDDACIIWSNAQEQHLSVLPFLSGVGYDRNSTYAQKLLQFTHHVDKQGGGIFEANHILIIRLNLLLRFLSLGNIYIHSLWFSFFAFIGSIGLYKVLHRFFVHRTWYLKLVLFCLPSLLFWSSGLLKETLVIGCLGLITYSLTSIFSIKVKSILKASSFIHLSLIFLFSISCWFLKPFIIISYFGSWLVYFAFSYKKKWWLVLPLVIVLYFGNDIANSLIAKRNEYTHLATNRHAGSLADTTIYSLDGLRAIVPITPSALKNLFWFPSLFSIRSINDIPFAIENLVFIILFGFHLKYLRSIELSQSGLYMALLAFGLTQLVIIGYSVPVVGAIVRYKVTAIPFMLLAFGLSVNLSKNKYDGL